MLNHGRHQRQNDQGDLNPVEEEPQQEHPEQNGQYHAIGAERQAKQRFFDNGITAKTPQHHGKGRCAEENCEDESGRACGLLQRRIQHFQSQTPGHQSQKQRTQCTNTRGFGGSGDASENRAQHTENQRRRGQNRLGNFPDNTPGHLLRTLRHRSNIRLQQRTNHRIAHIHGTQQQTGQKRPHKQVAHGSLRHRQAVCHQHQHDGRWNQDTQGAGGTGCTDGKALVVLVLHHHRQGQHTQKHH